MKRFYISKFNKKIVSLLVATVVAVFAVSPETSYAGYGHIYTSSDTFSNPYGEKSTDEEFYLWHRVKSDKVPMYKYLTDGNANEQEYKDHKQFRVMLIQHVNGGGFEEESLGGEKGEEYWAGWLSWKYKFNTYIQYIADWSRIDYGSINNFARDSFVSYKKNKQLQPTSDSFITRGSQRAFICSFEKQWENADKDHSGKLANCYEGLYKYNFYYPDKDDKKSEHTLCYCYDSNTFLFGCHNFYVYDDNGDPCGMKIDKDSEEYHRLNDGLEARYKFANDGDFSSTWALYDEDGKSEMRIIAYDEDGRDYSLCIWRNNQNNGWLGLHYSEPYDNWMVFVGEPCTEDMLANLAGKTDDGKDSLDKGYRTISTPTILRKEEEFTIGEDAALFVDTLLIVRGKLINNGILVVAPGAAIVCWDGAGGKIVNDRGDIIVKKNGVVFVNELEAQNQSLQLFSNLYAKNATVKDGVIASRNNAAVKGASDVNNYTFVKVAKKDGQNDAITIDSSKFSVTGSGTKVEISKDVLK